MTVELLDSAGNVVGTATTAGDGAYLFTRRDRRHLHRAGDRPQRLRQHDQPTRVPISVPPGGAATANFGDQQGGTVSGTVFSDLNGNGVQDPGERVSAA